MHRTGHGEQEKVDKVRVIVVSAASVNPGTVMVHLENASIALSAVVTSWRFVATAYFAIL